MFIHWIYWKSAASLKDLTHSHNIHHWRFWISHHIRAPISLTDTIYLKKFCLRVLCLTQLFNSWGSWGTLAWNFRHDFNLNWVQLNNSVVHLLTNWFLSLKENQAVHDDVFFSQSRIQSFSEWKSASNRLHRHIICHISFVSHPETVIRAFGVRPPCGAVVLRLCQLWPSVLSGGCVFLVSASVLPSSDPLRWCHYAHAAGGILGSVSPVVLTEYAVDVELSANQFGDIM